MTPLPPQKRDELVPAQILIAIALNAVRMITWLAATPHANMRPSRFAARRPRPAPHSSADRGRKSESLASGRRAYFGRPPGSCRKTPLSPPRAYWESWPFHRTRYSC